MSEGKRVLKRHSYELLLKNGQWEKQEREVYDVGDAATILLYHATRKTVILVRQLRMATYVNQNKDGMLTETCAGKLDGDSPEACIVREVAEETGYKIEQVTRLFDAYVAPGAVSELVYFFIAAYTDAMKTGLGGGLKEEGEDIELMEIPFGQAYNMVLNNEIRDAKTIILLQYLKINEQQLFRHH